jgi:hypothetical protein
MSASNVSAAPAEEALAREAVQQLMDVYADPNFRDQVKRGFITGRLAEYPGLFAPPGPVWKTVLRWIYIPMALTVFLFVLFQMNQGPGWTVLQTDRAGSVMVDGQRVSLSDEAVRRAFASGKTIELASAGPVLLVSRGQMMLELTPGTRMTMPTTTGRWFGRTARGELHEGMVRVTTGPTFQGAELRIRTPEALVLVDGTTFSVARDTRGTWVCVLEGEVMVARKQAKPLAVREGTRRFIFTGTRQGTADGLPARERARLSRHQQRALPILEHTRERAGEDD